MHSMVLVETPPIAGGTECGRRIVPVSVWTILGYPILVEDFLPRLVFPLLSMCYTFVTTAKLVRSLGRPNQL